ncbi:MAG: hypothetical protein KDA80_20840, partial [Planctomycetaceae bacterium]|nr:hypothetical protein [Planctomycetaceae bacterium]
MLGGLLSKNPDTCSIRTTQLVPLKCDSESGIVAANDTPLQLFTVPSRVDLVAKRITFPNSLMTSIIWPEFRVNLPLLAR